MKKSIIKLLNKNLGSSQRYAFTLAEVLITLGVIGVVAAMTIPTLMNKTGNAELVTAFKKEYSVLNSAWEQLIDDNGGSLVGAYTTGDKALDALCSKLRCAKICYSTDDRTQCFRDRDWTTLDKGPAWGSLLGSSAILPDGTSFSLRTWDSNCTSFGYKSTSCSQVYFDTNGLKPPNVMGRDIFELFMAQEKVVPTGASGTDQQNNLIYGCKNNGYNYAGCTCGAKILLDGRMNY